MSFVVSAYKPNIIIITNYNNVNQAIKWGYFTD